MPRPYRKRLTIDIPATTHKELKEFAEMSNCTMTRLIIRLIRRLLNRVEKFK
jgi:hypothetical protein